MFFDAHIVSVLRTRLACEYDEYHKHRQRLDTLAANRLMFKKEDVDAKPHVMGITHTHACSVSFSEQLTESYEHRASIYLRMRELATRERTSSEAHEMRQLRRTCMRLVCASVLCC